MRGKIQDKMLCCKSVNWEGYVVSIAPEGIKGKLKLSPTYSKTDIDSSTYYLSPCFNGLPITFILRATDKSDKHLTALKYLWVLSFADKDNSIVYNSNIGYLRRLSRGGRTLQDSFTIASEHILVPGQYKLQIQLFNYDGSVVMKGYPLANFDVMKWDTFFLFTAGLVVGLLVPIIPMVVGFLIGIVTSVIQMITIAVNN